MEKKQFYQATAMLMGTIIGAGIIGIPYVVSQSGLLLGLIIIFGVGGMLMMMNLFMGEVVLRTKGNHQFTGYARIYLGKWGERAMMFSMALNLYGALIAYTLGEGHSLAALFNIGTPLLWSAIFYTIFAHLIYRGIKAVAESELVMISVKLLIFAIVFIIILFSGKLNFTNLTQFNPSKIFLTYGVILFAYMGAVAIPEMKEVLFRQRKKLKKAILIASITPLVLYALFAFAVIGVTGLATTEVANVGLKTLGLIPVILINIFAILAMGTSFLTIGLALKEMYMYDYKFTEKKAWILTMLIPAILILIGVQSFAKTVATTGAIAGGLEGTLIVLMYWQAKKKGKRNPEYQLKTHHALGTLLVLIFLTGAILHIKGLF